MMNWCSSKRFRWGYWWLPVISGLLLPALPLCGQKPITETSWRFDVLQLRNGRTLHGLIVEDRPSLLRFQIVRQRPGQNTFVFPVFTFTREEVEQVRRLDADERAMLVKRLEALNPKDDREEQRKQNLELLVVPWNGRAGGGLDYCSEHFRLHSNAHEDIVRDAAVRLEDIYAAYTTLMPPRYQNRQPTRIILVESVQEYQALLKEMKRNILNLAFFDPQKNLVVCASELKSLGEDLEKVKQSHQEERANLDRLERSFPKGKVPADIRQYIDDLRRRMDAADIRNKKAYEDYTRRLFQTLYHEAFHAYLANYVYAPDEATVPIWLNEGLAQIFESAIVEAGDLRVGHADAERLRRVKDSLRDTGQLVPLVDLLRSEPKHFQVIHGGDQSISNQYYLTAWALAFYLAFERRLVGTAQMDDYVRQHQRPECDKLHAFQTLVGESLPRFEEKFHDYLRHLRSDGTVVRRPDNGVKP
ncbi:MAG: DUF1570 domain-containing protein [Gemmataceae bacterium]